jgi:hypothetical protein
MQKMTKQWYNGVSQLPSSDEEVVGDKNVTDKEDFLEDAL